VSKLREIPLEIAEVYESQMVAGRVAPRFWDIVKISQTAFSAKHILVCIDG